VIDDKLVSAVKEIGESFPAIGGIEDIVFFDFDPRKPAALDGKGFAFVSQLPLFGE
jgi:hypothetical protein